MHLVRFSSPKYDIDWYAKSNTRGLKAGTRVDNTAKPMDEGHISYETIDSFMARLRKYRKSHRNK